MTAFVLKSTDHVLSLSSCKSSLRLAPQQAHEKQRVEIERICRSCAGTAGTNLRLSQAFNLSCGCLDDQADRGNLAEYLR